MLMIIMLRMSAVRVAPVKIPSSWKQITPRIDDNATHGK
jgi:hypothetical protein